MRESNASPAPAIEDATIPRIRPSRIAIENVTARPYLVRASTPQSRPFNALLTGRRGIWQKARDHVDLDPANLPAAVFRLERWGRSDRDFDCCA